MIQRLLLATENSSYLFLTFLLFFISSVVIFPYTWTHGSVRIEGYTYSSQAAMLAEQNKLFPDDERIQREFHFFEHPLLFKWMQAGIFKIMGISEYTSKILVALMGCSLVLLVFWMGSYFFSPWAGFVSGLFLLISPRFMIHSSLCMLDIPLIFFTTLSIFSAVFASQKQKVFYLLSGVSLGCAILIKGAFGLLPIPLILFYLFISKKHKDFFSPYFILGALQPLFFIYLYNFLLSLHHPGITLNSFWRTQGYAPVKDNFFYVKVIFQRYFYLLPPIVILLWKWGLTKTKNLIISTEQKNFASLLFFWCIAVIAILSMVASKKQGYYLLPLNPALALLCGIGCEFILSHFLKTKFIEISLFLSALLALIFSATPFTLHKEKVLREQGYWKQYWDIEWPLTELLNEGHIIYYSPGLHYILNFKFSENFSKNQLLPIEQIKKTHEPIVVLIDKNYKRFTQNQNDAHGSQNNTHPPQDKILFETHNLLLLRTGDPSSILPSK